MDSGNCRYSKYIVHPVRGPHSSRKTNTPLFLSLSLSAKAPTVRAWRPNDYVSDEEEASSPLLLPGVRGPCPKRCRSVRQHHSPNHQMEVILILFCFILKLLDRIKYSKLSLRFWTFFFVFFLLPYFISVFCHKTWDGRVVLFFVNVFTDLSYSTKSEKEKAVLNNDKKEGQWGSLHCVLHFSCLGSTLLS